MGDVIKLKNQDNALEIKICSYRTWLKKNPDVQKYELWDGVKGWIRETINPTLKKNGWKECINEWDYGLFRNEKPKQMAIRLLKNTFGEEWMKDIIFVIKIIMK